MQKYKLLSEIKKLYDKGENIIQYLKLYHSDKQMNSTDDIMISYDFQAGEYTEEYKRKPQFKEQFVKKVIEKLSEKSICIEGKVLEVGVAKQQHF